MLGNPDSPVEGLIHSLRDYRVRQAILVTALLRSGAASLEISHSDVFASARHDIAVEQTAAGYRVSLQPAPA